MKIFPGILGVTVTLALITSTLSCQPVDVPEGQNSVQLTKIGGLIGTKMAVEESMLTQVAPWVLNNMPSSFNQLETKVVVINTQIEGRRTGNLQYYEDFDDQVADGIEMTPGQFVIDPTYEGNSYWQNTGNHSISKIRLPSPLRFYVIEFMIHTLDNTGNNPGLGGIFLGDANSNCPDYEVSIANNMIKLSERDTSCSLADYHEFPVVPSLENAWHKFRVEVKENAIILYIDNYFQSQPVYGDEELLKIDTIGFWTCCDHTLPYTLLIDDLQVWRP